MTPDSEISPQLRPIRATAIRRQLCRTVILAPLILLAGCAFWRRQAPMPPEVTDTGIAARVLISPDLNVNPAETVVKPDDPSQLSADPSSSGSSEAEPTTFTLGDAINFALRNNPRLRSARAVVERARGQERMAFAPFLPEMDILSRVGGTSANLSPGGPGTTGIILPQGVGAHSYAQAEAGLQWTLYDFGRTGGRYQQAVARERIAELQTARADQTVAFDVAAAYIDILLARASRRVQEEAIRRAEAILEDTQVRWKAGDALREDVLRAEVQLSESRQALVLSRKWEFDAIARLNHAMGRNAGWLLEVVDLDPQPALPGTLANYLERAATQRLEVGLAREAVAAAQAGREAAKAAFLPRIYIRASLGQVDGQNILTGLQEGAGLHLDTPLYAGGRRLGELQTAEADIESAVAEAQSILDAISLEVNLAYRDLVAARELIELSRTAVVQAQEYLRLVGVRYRNGNASPTDIVDSEAALTRSQQRFFSATYSYLAALARLDYALGQQQGASLGDLPPKVE